MDDRNVDEMSMAPGLCRPHYQNARLEPKLPGPDTLGASFLASRHGQHGHGPSSGSVLKAGHVRRRQPGAQNNMQTLMRARLHHRNQGVHRNGTHTEERKAYLSYSRI